MMIDVLLGSPADEYDLIYADIMRLAPIFHLPDEIRTQLFYAFGELANRCRAKDRVILALSQKLGEEGEK